MPKETNLITPIVDAARGALASGRSRCQARLVGSHLEEHRCAKPLGHIGRHETPGMLRCPLGTSPSVFGPARNWEEQPLGQVVEIGRRSSVLEREVAEWERFAEMLFREHGLRDSRRETLYAYVHELGRELGEFRRRATEARHAAKVATEKAGEAFEKRDELELENRRLRDCAVERLMKASGWYEELEAKCQKLDALIKRSNAPTGAALFRRRVKETKSIPVGAIPGGLGTLSFDPLGSTITIKWSDEAIYSGLGHGELAQIPYKTWRALPLKVYADNWWHLCAKVGLTEGVARALYLHPEEGTESAAARAPAAARASKPEVDGVGWDPESL